MWSIIFKLCFIADHLKNGISRRFLIWYNIQMCSHNGIQFEYPSSVRMYGKHVLRISKSAKVNIGRNFISRSGEESGIEAAVTKIVVGENASLTIGNNCGISNATILCNNAITIGDHVLFGGA